MFNTHPLCLANLGALQMKIADNSERRAKQEYTKETIMDLVSQVFARGIRSVSTTTRTNTSGCTSTSRSKAQAQAQSLPSASLG